MLNKILVFYTKFFALWVMLLAVVAYFFPAPFMVKPLVMKSFFALTMFGIGAVLSIEDFKRIGQRPIIVIIGSIAQFTIMPLGAYVLAKLFNLPDTLAAGRRQTHRITRPIIIPGQIAVISPFSR